MPGYRKRDYQPSNLIRRGLAYQVESDDEEDNPADRGQAGLEGALFEKVAETYAELAAIPREQGYPLLERCTLYDFATFLEMLGATEK